MSDDENMQELYDEERYEKERLENIRNNAALMSSLGLEPRPKIEKDKAGPAPKKMTISAEEARRRRESKAKEAALRRVQPSRRSGRVAARDSAAKDQRSASPAVDVTPRPRYNPLPKAVAPVLAPAPSYTPGDGDLGTAPRPTRDERGQLQFEGRWKGVFTPNLTPEEMFAGGAFGGSFFVDTYSQLLKAPLVAHVDVAELPFTLSPPSVSRLLTNTTPDAEVNRWKVRAGQNLQEWEKAGWIWAGDPRGWAQWYVRFWDGRRCEDDERQVKRWMKVAGPTGRFKRALLKKLQLSGGREAVADEEVAPVLRQCLWQWGYELNAGEYDEALNG
ncbi:hypothetical protein IAT38_000728 [Cryptococcus sp. DSM 104549]